jgi:murein DD-endopeptidase MepM/ murein hydrolase activator NlpD
MKQEYFVVVLAHSLRGRLRRVHISHRAVYVTLALALLGCFALFGFVASYAGMMWRVANYNALRREADQIRTRYRTLQEVVSQRNQRLASLEVFATEVRAAYGIEQKRGGPSDISTEGKLVPSFADRIADYNYLRTANILALGSRANRHFLAADAQPSIWPVDGRLNGAFGERTDPFSGEGAFHQGVDISAPTGTPIRATADGIVLFAEMEKGYGRLVKIEHGNSVETYYAHLSRFYVQAGQDVRRGEMIGEVGSSGRSTAPHLHYEVRLGGAPVNPYRYLATTSVFQQPIGPGIAQVRREVIRTPAAAAPAAFWVQVGAFLHRGNAERNRDEMQARYGYAQALLEKGFWRVLVGRKPTEEAANVLAIQILRDAPEKKDAFVVRLDSVTTLKGRSTSGLAETQGGGDEISAPPAASSTASSLNLSAKAASYPQISQTSQQELWANERMIAGVIDLRSPPMLPLRDCFRRSNMPDIWGGRRLQVR